MSVAGLGRLLWRLAPPIAVGLLLGALGLELVARWQWHDAWDRPKTPVGPGGETLPVYESTAEMSSPNARGINRYVYFRTNSRGIRGPEYERKPPDGVFRILVTGDSTTMGSGVAEEDRYTNQLEHLLEGDDPERGYQVVNLGLSGFNTRAATKRLESLAPHYHSHLFVYGFSTNDIEGPAYRTRSGRPAHEAGRQYWETVAKLESSPSYLWRFLGARRLSPLGGDEHAETLENFLENPEAWDDFVTWLDRFAQAARFRGLCGVVLLHTDLWDLDESHPYLEIYGRVEHAARERGLAVVQSFPYFEGRDAKPLWVSLFDPHPNREAHALLARALFDGLKELPPECWETAGAGSPERGARS